MKKILIALAALLVVPFVLVSVFKLSPGRLFSSAVKPQSKYDLSPSELKHRLNALEEQLPEVEALIEQSKYVEARNRFGAIFNEGLNPIKQISGQKALGEGRTFISEVDRLEARVGQAARRRFDRQVAEIEKGGRNTANLQRLINAFPDTGHNNLVQELAARSAELDGKRAPLATRWIRILHEGTSDDFDETITTALNQAVLPAGYSFVHGPAMGPAETAATFSTITVKVVTHFEGYSLIQRFSGGATKPKEFTIGGGDGLLTNLDVTFSVHNAFAGYPTSWDNLPIPGQPANAQRSDLKVALAYTMPAPEEVAGKGELELREDFRNRNQDRLAALKSKLAHDLAALPVLDYIPDRNSGPPLISRQAALLDQAMFIQAATAELAANKSVGLIANITAELCIEPLADAVEKYLGELTPEEQRQLGRTLDTRPWFHGSHIAQQLAATPALEPIPTTINVQTLDLKQAPARLERILRGRPLEEQVPVIIRLAQEARNPPGSASPARETPGITLLEFLQNPNRPSAARYLRQQSQGSSPEDALKLSKALAAALNSPLHRDNDVVVLLPDERDIFLRALETNQGKQREEAIANLPRSPELVSLLLQKYQPTWDGGQSVALFRFTDRVHGPEEGAVGAALNKCVLQSYRAGLFNTPELLREGESALGSRCCRTYFAQVDANQKITLIMQLLDARTPQDATFHGQFLSYLILSLDARSLLRNPNARALLTKGKTYPHRRVQMMIFELTTQAVKINPAYGNLK